MKRQIPFVALIATLLFTACQEKKAPQAEPEDTDTTTYAELAQVYREGVNSIE